MNERLNFQQTLSALQALLGRYVIVTFGNFAFAHHEGVAGFSGLLTHANRPEDWMVDLMQAEDADRIYNFFVGRDKPLAGGWFALDERIFHATDYSLMDEDPRVAERLSIATHGCNLILSFPSDEYIREIGLEPPPSG